MTYTNVPGTAYWFQEKWKDHWVLRKRLAAWEREAETNKNGFACIAPAVVSELKAQLAVYENARTTGPLG